MKFKIKNGLNLINKYLPLFSIFLGFVFYLSYFYIYLSKGSFAFLLRSLVLISTILLLFNLIYNIYLNKLPKKWYKLIFLIISFISMLILIYIFITRDEKYIFANNIICLLYNFAIVSILCSKFLDDLDEKNINLYEILSLGFMIILLFTEIFGIVKEKSSYQLNLVGLFILGLSLFLGSIDFNRINKLIFNIAIFLGNIALLVIGFVARKHFTTFDDFNWTSFVTIFSSLCFIIVFISLIDKPKTKLGFISLVLNTLAFIALIVVFIGIKNTTIKYASDINKINIFRILVLLPSVIIVINECFMINLKQKLYTYIISGALTLFYVICFIILLRKTHEISYYFFTSYAVFTSIIFLLLVFIEIIKVYSRRSLTKEVSN